MKLIELSRNKTHSILERNYKAFYHVYRPSIELFFNNLLTTTYKNFQYNIKYNVDELFRNFLRITIALNDNNSKQILPSYLLCLWKNHPFNNRLSLVVSQLEINLGKVFHLNELFQLNVELVQFVTMVSLKVHCF